MKTRRIGFVLAFAGVISAAASPALAAPVEIKQVRQVLKGNYKQGGENTSLDLRLAGEGDEKKPAATAQDPNNPGGTQERPAVMNAQEEIQEDITVESCDCPDLPLDRVPPGRGFPKWLLGLGALPLVCLTGVCTSDNPPNFTPPGSVNPTPTPGGGGVDPTPTPPVPEPATLLLFGSGLLALGAAARRRREM